MGDYAPNELLEMEFDPAYVRPLELLDQLGPRAIKLGLRRVEGDIPGYPFDHVAYGGTAQRLQKALSEVGINAEVRAHLFTRSEHLILSSWFHTRPNEAKESLGRRHRPDSEIETLARKISACEGDQCLDAAVATILLRSIEDRLPNFTIWGAPRNRMLSDNCPPSAPPHHSARATVGSFASASDPVW